MNSVEFLKSLTFTRPLTDREMAVFKHARAGRPLTCVEEGILLQATSTFNYNDICEDICVKETNRSFTQRILQEIYVPVGQEKFVFGSTGLRNINLKDDFIRYWKLNDHNEAVRHIRLVIDNLNKFKDLLETMSFHITCKEVRNITRLRYKQIIEYYEKTGFLEELPTYF